MSVLQALVMGQRGVQVRVHRRGFTHVHLIPLPKTDTQTNTDMGGHSCQKHQGVEVRIQVRHQKELPQPARPQGGRRATGGDGRLEEHTPGPGRRRDVKYVKGSTGCPNPESGVGLPVRREEAAHMALEEEPQLRGRGDRPQGPAKYCPHHSLAWDPGHSRLLTS